jgi:RNA polymerase sigma factor (sigma-70 family)
MTADSPLPLEQLLAQSDWVTTLARALVTDAATADDIAQATWIDVLRSPPRSVVDPRAWLAAIVRRKALRSLRTDARRSRREQVATAPHRGDTAPSAADLAARVATHRELVDAVLALDEPYRETVVLRFFENLDLEAIAQRTQSKHNTVRSRLQRGLQQLRERLDRAPGGRERWLPAVLLLSRRRLAEGATVGGVAGGIALAITMKKLVFGAVALAAGLLFALPMLWPDAPARARAKPATLAPSPLAGQRRTHRQPPRTNQSAPRCSARPL